MNRNRYIYLSAAELHHYLDCSEIEANTVRNLGLLTPCNFGTRGLSSYRKEDLQAAMVAIQEARDSGVPLGSDYKPLPPPKTIKADGDLPLGEIIGEAEDDQLTETEHASDDEDEALMEG